MEGSSCQVCGGIISGGFCTNSSCLDSPNWKLNTGKKNTIASKQKKTSAPKQKSTHANPKKNNTNNEQGAITSICFIGLLIYLFAFQEFGLLVSAIISAGVSAVVYRYYKAVQVLLSILIVAVILFFLSQG